MLDSILALAARACTAAHAAMAQAKALLDDLEQAKAKLPPGADFDIPTLLYRTGLRWIPAVLNGERPTGALSTEEWDETRKQIEAARAKLPELVGEVMRYSYTHH